MNDFNLFRKIARSRLPQILRIKIPSPFHSGFISLRLTNEKYDECPCFLVQQGQPGSSEKRTSLSLPSTALKRIQLSISALSTSVAMWLFYTVLLLHNSFAYFLFSFAILSFLFL